MPVPEVVGRRDVFCYQTLSVVFHFMPRLPRIDSVRGFLAVGELVECCADVLKTLQLGFLHVFLFCQLFGMRAEPHALLHIRVE